MAETTTKSKRRGDRGSTKVSLKELVTHLKHPDHYNYPREECIRWLMEQGLSHTGAIKKLEALVRDGHATRDAKDQFNLTRAGFRVLADSV